MTITDEQKKIINALHRGVKQVILEEREASEKQLRHFRKEVNDSMVILAELRGQVEELKEVLKSELWEVARKIQRREGP